MRHPPAHVGVDFGTSNSAVALFDGTGEVRFAEFSLFGRPTVSYRSLLFFDPDAQEVGAPIDYAAGTQGIEAYLDAMGEGRLIQSFKSHLTSAATGRTQIGPHHLDLDDLLMLFLRRLRSSAQRSLGFAPAYAVFGRPVHFVDAQDADDDARAVQRLERAAIRAGFDEVRFALEPLGAAYHYERRLQRLELVLVADFGGGTTDFCLVRLGPERREHTAREEDIVATGGIGIAGDDLDAAIIEHVVAPALGKGSTYTSMGKDHTVPNSYYYKLSRWHLLSFLRGEKTRSELLRLSRLSHEPEAIERLIHVIEANQGFHLHKAVEQLKVRLSSADEAEFTYHDGPVDLRVRVTRRDFEAWIEPQVGQIERCLDETLAAAGFVPAQIDRVFMTGGTAFVPAVRRRFESRFGADKLRSGDELVSIASGLAVHAGQRWRAA